MNFRSFPETGSEAASATTAATATAAAAAFQFDDFDGCAERSD